MSIGVSLKKFTDTDNTPNEDSYRIEHDFIAISDGAGGCGVFASEWSKYLVDNLPNTPIKSYKELDRWVDGIWEYFFQEHEKIALRYDGIFQSKFYAEGSCATIAAAWRVDKNNCQWMSYGDSVVFHYNKKTDKLDYYGIKSLANFSKSPYLISCKDPMQEEGFWSGRFTIDDDSVVFACSDALSHYVLMMYMVTDYDKYNQDITAIAKSRSIDSTMIGIATSIDRIDFYTDIILKLEDAASSEEDFAKVMKDLYEGGLIEIDDYTIVFLNDKECNIH